MRIKKNIAISESGFMFNPITGESFTVNPIGTEILQMINDGFESDQIIEAICNKYQVDQHTFDKDLTDFTGMLDHHHLSQHHDKEEA
ncbi:MAG TPA: HPr-rel-A system PqqD family protein [Bacteroidales bacterium]|nr:MAG: hypothetical protein A2X11_00545 [Bacteroidetes bacterium GWE2_42_24]OFY27543.1 MAG: hypothetical protein A2X09_07680 [Bacteroidetes bacterium GWF2_43_11]PKP23805.1 MAG: HPr-rel-A system PqqD family protein [Bacteroidetes bacterium HGW-Bacteroidetes-22]HAQ64976.1 HPr-rel-A system PqqD family protein [Bacteroidales bacterium]HBZ66067.1 HPr-rel-A system PqqD family protein [Bacteroidales bacterium]